MELRDIEYFAVIAEHGHLGRAAETLDLSPTALSKSLRRLEKSVQAKLVRRTPKGVALTPEGALLLSRVHGLRMSLQDISREISDLSRGRSGSLRMGSHPGMVDDFVNPASVTLFDESANLTMHVTVGANDTLLPALQTGELDLVVSDIPGVPYEDLVHEHLFDDELVVFASVNHPLTRKKRVSASELDGERWIATTASKPGSLLPRVWADLGLREPRFALYTTSLPLRDHVVASTHILGTSSRRILSRIARTLAVAEIQIRDLNWVRHVGISYRRNAYLSPVARRMIKLLKEAAQKAMPNASLKPREGPGQPHHRR